MGWFFGVVVLAYLTLLYVKLYFRTAGRPVTAVRAWLGFGLGVGELARRLDLPVADLTTFEVRYRGAAIPKRGGGVRRLQIPDDRTKALQRRILRRVLARLRAHPAACGFEKGRSIVHNAAPHVGHAVVVRMDVEDFFTATRADRVEAYFRRVGWNRAAAALLTRLTTFDGGLPQGAPTSPRLSNLVNYHLDHVLAEKARWWSGAYTRYADDLTFSLRRERKRRARGVVQFTRRLLKAHGYRMHERRKLSIRRRHQRQTVTGLVVNEKVQLPRTTRRWLRAVRHRAATGGEPTLDAAQLQGWSALEAMIREQAAQSRRDSEDGPPR